MEVQTEKSYFDGGLLQLIGWQILGGLVKGQYAGFGDAGKGRAYLILPNVYRLGHFNF